MKLQTKYLLPASTLQHMVEEILEVHQLGQTLMCQKIMQRMSELQVPNYKVKELVDDITSPDLLTNCSSQQLRSEYAK